MFGLTVLTAPRFARGKLGLCHAPQRAANVGFEGLVGEAWTRLPIAIRARFQGHIQAGNPRHYVGQIMTTKLTIWGQLLAYLLLPFGAPLPLRQSQGGEAAHVTVSADPTHTSPHAQIWTRNYGTTKGLPQIIHTTKCFEGPTGLEERLGKGLGRFIGMSLRLEVGVNALHFISTRFFCLMFGHKVWLPKWMEPGQMIVTHEAVTEDQFIFRLNLTHPCFGLLVEQACQFEDTKEI